MLNLHASTAVCGKEADDCLCGEARDIDRSGAGRAVPPTFAPHPALQSRQPPYPCHSLLFLAPALVLNWAAQQPGAARWPAMRNLLCASDRAVALALPEELGDVAHFALDAESGALFIAGSGLGVAAYRTADSQVRQGLPALRGSW